tara:strand:+ start:2990 stop:3265 length:276 start_codon:yes stop_codon:yes gene_type:complete
MEYNYYSAGWLKDLMATIFFLAAIIIIVKSSSRRNKLIEVILIGLLLAFAIDFTFTLNPEYNNIPIGYNRPTYITLLTGVTGLIMAIRYLS